MNNFQSQTQIKKLLKIYSFLPIKFEYVARGWRTGVILDPTDYSEERLQILIQRCGQTKISDCFFKGDRFTFGLDSAAIEPISVPWNPQQSAIINKGCLNVSFYLSLGVNGDLHQHRPSKEDIDRFLCFLGGGNE